MRIDPPTTDEKPSKRCTCLSCLLVAMSPFIVLVIPVVVLFLQLLGPWVKEALLGFPDRDKIIVAGYDYRLHENPYTEGETWYTFTSDMYDYYFEECILLQGMSVLDGYLYFEGDGFKRIEIKSGKAESLRQLSAGIELTPIDVFFKQLPKSLY